MIEQAALILLTCIGEKIFLHITQNCFHFSTHLVLEGLHVWPIGTELLESLLFKNGLKQKKVEIIEVDCFRISIFCLLRKRSYVVQKEQN
jgi:hypothetical protein